jgi:hypothetical protein
MVLFTQVVAAVRLTVAVAVVVMEEVALVLVVIQHQLLHLEHQTLAVVVEVAAVLKLETSLEPEARAL